MRGRNSTEALVAFVASLCTTQPHPKGSVTWSQVPLGSVLNNNKKKESRCKFPWSVEQGDGPVVDRIVRYPFCVRTHAVGPHTGRFMTNAPQGASGNTRWVSQSMQLWKVVGGRSSVVSRSHGVVHTEGLQLLPRADCCWSNRCINMHHQETGRYSSTNAQSRRLDYLCLMDTSPVTGRLCTARSSQPNPNAVPSCDRPPAHDERVWPVRPVQNCTEQCVRNRAGGGHRQGSLSSRNQRFCWWCCTHLEAASGN